MTPEREEQLLTTYATFFHPNFWGFECNDGWFSLIESLCRTVKRYEGKVQIIQVKEKFGGLRFYVSGGDEFLRGAITFAENFSYKVCEDCGSEGAPNDEGWISTLCGPCRFKRRKANEPNSEA